MNFPIGGEQPIFPEELGTLRIVFSQLCEEHEILTTSGEAGELASELVRLFQTRIKDETVLMVLMRARFEPLAGPVRRLVKVVPVTRWVVSFDHSRMEENLCCTLVTALVRARLKCCLAFAGLCATRANCRLLRPMPKKRLLTC